MSRRSNQRYVCHALEELCRQLLYAPPDRRIEDIRRAEQLHDELDPGQNYPQEFLAYRITAHRLPEPDGTTLVGEAVLPDLRLMIDSLSRSIDLPPSDTEAEETIDALAGRLGVSGKTIGRWRRSGLRWRWVTPTAGGAKRVVIPASALAHYQAQHPGRAQQAAAFSRMTAAQRRGLLEQARLLVDGDPGLSLNRVAARLAESSGRGLETIREMLQRHDQTRPGSAIFTNRDVPLDKAQRAAIERSYLAGEKAASLAERFGRTPSTIYRVVQQSRARRAQGHRFAFHASPNFERDDAAQVLLRPIAPPGPTARRPDPPALNALPEPIREVFDRPLPPDRLMVALLMRYNYLKYRAAQEQQTLRQGRPKSTDLDRFETLARDAAAARSSCVRAALPLILSVCRRHEDATDERPAERLTGLLATAYPVLVALVESHDAARSARFESVLTNRLLRTFAHPDEAPTDAGSTEQRLAAELEALGPAYGNA